VKRYGKIEETRNKNKMATKEDNASIDVSKPKLEKFRGNDRDTLDIKTWCLQVSRLDTVQKLGDENTAIIVMEALREQALSWALLLQDERPASAASWKLLQPLFFTRNDMVYFHEAIFPFPRTQLSIQ
jgi:hypothetical protein